MAFVSVEQAGFWSRLAPVWLELEDQLEEVGGPPGQLAMDRLELRPGQRVVDLGCGSGRTTLELADRVGPGGEVAGVDISAGMLSEPHPNGRSVAPVCTNTHRQAAGERPGPPPCLENRPASTGAAPGGALAEPGFFDGI